MIIITKIKHAKELNMRPVRDTGFTVLREENHGVNVPLKFTFTRAHLLLRPANHQRGGADARSGRAELAAGPLTGRG